MYDDRLANTTAFILRTASPTTASG